MERGERGSSIMSTYIGINTKNSGLVQRSISDCLKCCNASLGSCVSKHKPPVNKNQMRARARGTKCGHSDLSLPLEKRGEDAPEIQQDFRRLQQLFDWRYLGDSSRY